jgi:hypothetical protein
VNLIDSQIGGSWVNLLGVSEIGWLVVVGWLVELVS